MTGEYYNTQCTACLILISSLDYTVFGNSDFDPNEYANATLAGEPYPPQPGRVKPTRTAGLAPANEDISVAISKLNFSIDDIEKQLKNVVRTTRQSSWIRGLMPR